MDVGEPFSPLDQILKLRRDQWSEGAARVATEQGLQASSFARAAQAYSRAIGESISKDSVRRITEGFGGQVHALRKAEVEKAYMVEAGQRPGEKHIEEVQPVEERGNISTDGTMILLRGEGRKEVKLTVISTCEVEAAEQRKGDTVRRGEDPWVKLKAHSCQAGVWEADTMARYQYAEGLRRGLEKCPKLSSVNDAAAWIGRITEENFPQAEQIVDWSHAAGWVWKVAHELYGEGSSEAKRWAKGKLDKLWRGSAQDIAQAIGHLDAEGDIVRQAEGYFTSHADHMHYATYRAAGYPIGSGTVESGGKNYVQHRMKRPGPGWCRDLAQSMLAVLSELHSGRFDLVWEQCA